MEEKMIKNKILVKSGSSSKGTKKEKERKENATLVNNTSALDILQDKPKLTYGDKKARKAVQSMGLKLVPGVARVAIRKVDNVLLMIEDPEVYRNSAGNFYIVLGKLTFADVARNLKEAAAEKFTQEVLEPRKAAQVEVPEGSDDEVETDDEGMDKQDIQMVVTQANVSRTEAIRALKRNSLDIVDAILDCMK